MMNCEPISKYEKAYLIGARMLQLEAGELPVYTVDNTDLSSNSLIDIAENDVKSGILKYVIWRNDGRGSNIEYEVLQNFMCTCVTTL